MKHPVIILLLCVFTLSAVPSAQAAHSDSWDRIEGFGKMECGALFDALRNFDEFHKEVPRNAVHVDAIKWGDADFQKYLRRHLQNLTIIRRC